MIKGRADFRLSKEIKQFFILEVKINETVFYSENSKNPFIKLNFIHNFDNRIIISIRLLEHLKIYCNIVFKTDFVVDLKLIRNKILVKIDKFEENYLTFEFSNFKAVAKTAKSYFFQEENQGNRLDLEKGFYLKNLERIERLPLNFETEKYPTTYQILLNFIKKKIHNDYKKEKSDYFIQATSIMNKTSRYVEYKKCSFNKKPKLIKKNNFVNERFFYNSAFCCLPTGEILVSGGMTPENKLKNKGIYLINPKQKKGHLITVLESYIKNHQMIYRNGKLFIIYDYVNVSASISNNANKYITMIDFHNRNKKVKSVHKLPNIAPETFNFFYNKKNFFLIPKKLEMNVFIYKMNLLSAFEKIQISLDAIYKNLIPILETQRNVFFLALNEKTANIELILFDFINKNFTSSKTFEIKADLLSSFFIGKTFYCKNIDNTEFYQFNSDLERSNEKKEFQIIENFDVKTLKEDFNHQNELKPTLYMKASYMFENYPRKHFIEISNSDSFKEKVLSFHPLYQIKNFPLKDVNIIKTAELVDGTIFLYCSYKNQEDKPICFIYTHLGVINIRSNNLIRKKMSIVNDKEYVFLIGGTVKTNQIEIFDLLYGDWIKPINLINEIGINHSLIIDNIIYTFYVDNKKVKLLIFNIQNMQEIFLNDVGFEFATENFEEIKSVICKSEIFFYYKDRSRSFVYNLLKNEFNLLDLKLKSSEKIVYVQSSGKKLEFFINLKSKIKKFELDLNTEDKVVDLLNEKNSKVMNSIEKNFFNLFVPSDKNEIFKTNTTEFFVIFMYYRYENSNAGVRNHKKSIVLSDDKIFEINLNMNRVKQLDFQDFEFPKYSKSIYINKNQIALVGGFYLKSDKMIPNGITFVNLTAFTVKKIFFSEISIKNHCVYHDGDKIIILGGENFKNQKSHQNCYYDLSTSRLRQFPNFKIKRANHEVFKFGSGILAFFGEGEDGRVLRSVEVYNKYTNEWKVWKTFDFGLKNFRLFSYASDIICILGGIDTEAAFNLKVYKLNLKNENNIKIIEAFTAPQNFTDFEMIQHNEQFYLYQKNINLNYIIDFRKDKIKFRLSEKINFFGKNDFKINSIILKKDTYGENTFKTNIEKKFNNLYIFGTNLVNKIFKLDLRNLQWSTLKTPETLKLMDHSGSATLNDGRIFIGGGLSSSLTTIYKTCYIIDFNNTVEPVQIIQPMHFQRYTFPAIELNGYIYVLGGRQYGNAELGIYNNCEKYSIKKNYWKQIAPLHNRRCTSNVTIYNGQIYVFGGYFGSGRVSEIEKYNEFYDNWEIIQMSLQYFIDGALLLHISEEEVLILGGKDEFNHQNSVVSYNLETGVVLKRENLNFFHTLSKGGVYDDLAICLGGCNTQEIEVFQLPYEKSIIKNKIEFLPIKDFGKTIFVQSK